MSRKKIVVPSQKTEKLATPVTSEPDLNSTNPPSGPDLEIIEAPTERKKIVIPSPKSSKIAVEVPSSKSDLSNTVKPASQELAITYQPSETAQLVQEIDSGGAGRVQLQINPKTGKQIRNNQSKTLVNLEKNLSE